MRLPGSENQSVTDVEADGRTDGRTSGRIWYSKDALCFNRAQRVKTNETNSCYQTKD